MTRLETWIGRRPWAAHVALLLAVAVAWAGAVHPGVLTRDTRWLVVDNPLLSTGSWSVVPAILWDMGTETRIALGKEYLPVRDLSVLLDFALFGDRWALHHLHSWLWYAAGCSALLALLLRVLDRPLLAWVVALVVALHPVHAENVVWLAGRKDVLSWAWFFAALLAATGGRRGQYGAALLFALAVWSKGTAIVLPACAVGVWWLQDRRRAWRPLVGPMVALGAVAAVALAVSLQVGRSLAIIRAPWADGPLELVVLQGRMLLRYLDLMLWTGHHGVLHPEPVTRPLAQAINGLGLLALGAGVAAVAATWRRRPVVAFGLVWFAVTMLPMAQLVPLQNLITDRYLLLPSVGLVLAVAAAVPARWVGWGLALVPVLIWSCSQRAQVWQSDLALWADGRDHVPERLLTWTTHARFLDQAGRSDEAAALRSETLLAFPDDPQALATVGAVSVSRGDVAAAEQQLGQALALDPEHPLALNNLVVLYNGLGQPERALPHGRVLLAAHPDYLAGLTSVGVSFLMLGRNETALALFKDAVRGDPSDARGHCNVGSAAYGAGDLALAARAWGNCLARDPDSPVATRGLAALRAGGSAPGALGEQP